MRKNEMYYRNIIVGAGASGLYCACALGETAEKVQGSMYKNSGHEETLILEKKSRAGIKLLMSGSGQCNITHGGFIKEFIAHYGDNGRRIRKVLQEHNNVELCRFMEKLNVPLTEREDGKIFPSSMDSRDVLEALLKEICRKGINIRYNTPVVSITKDKTTGVFNVETPEECFSCSNLIIAAGGCSYPSTGSDGSVLKIIREKFDLEIIEPVPALTPVYVENYSFGRLSGVSFENVAVTIEKRTFRGDLLFTQKSLSGPLILNNSRYLSAGAAFTLNFLAPVSRPEAAARFKKDFPGNGKSPQSYMAGDLGLPKRFAQQIASELDINSNKVSQLSGSRIKDLASVLTAYPFKVKELGGFKEAMVTKGGISLDELDTAKMSSKKYRGLYFIGEIVDVDGDTGGYNLQFAFSSAAAAAHDIISKL